MTESTYFFGYKRQFRENYWNSISIDEQGVVSVICMLSRPGMPIRKLGQFRLELPGDDADLERARRLVRDHGLDQESAEPTQPAGRGYRVDISIRKGGKWTVHSFLASMPPPPSLAALEETLLEIMNRCAANPLRALSMEMSTGFESVSPGKMVCVRLDMVHHGKFPLRFCNPASKARLGGCSLVFFVWSVKNTSPSAEETEYHATIETLGSEYVINRHEVIPSDQDYLSLIPGERLSSTVSFRFPKYKAGRYELQLVYNSMGILGKPNDLIFGGYHGDPFGFTVAF